MSRSRDDDGGASARRNAVRPISRTEIVLGILATYLMGPLFVGISPVLGFALDAVLCAFIAIRAYGSRAVLGMEWVYLPAVFSLIYLWSAVAVPSFLHPAEVTFSETQYGTSVQNGR